MRKSTLIVSLISAAAMLAIATGGTPVQAKSKASAQTNKSQNKTSQAKKTEKKVTIKKVTVGSGDSLSGIAQKHNTTWVRLYNANTEVKDPNLIYPGQILRIPGAKEKLKSRQVAAVQPSQPVHRPQARVASTVAAQLRQYQPPQSAASTGGDTVWDRLAQCESGGNWHINTGNGFSGGLQFTPSTWAAHGGQGAAQNASREQQIAVAKRVQASQGWGAWPACSAKLGLR